MSGTVWGSAHGDDEAMSKLSEDLQLNDFDDFFTNFTILEFLCLRLPTRPLKACVTKIETQQ